jgi:hypothetical protein
MSGEPIRPAASDNGPPVAAPDSTVLVDAVNTPVGDHTTAALSIPLAQPRAIESLEEFLKRPQLITTVSFPLTLATAIATLNPLTSFFANTVIANKLAYLKHWRGTLCVRAEMPVNPHFYGEAFFALVPTLVAANGTTLWRERVYQMRPGGIFNANTGNPVILRLPFVFPVPKVQILSTTDTNAFATLYVAPLSPLGRDDAVAVGTPSFNIYVWLEDTELLDATPYLTVGGPKQKPKSRTDPSILAGMNRDFQRQLGTIQAQQQFSGGAGTPPLPPKNPVPPSKKETSPGLLSSAASAVSHGLRTYLPMLPGANLAAGIADMAGSVASFFGYSRPNQPQELTFMKPRSVSFLASGIGQDSNTVLALDPAASRDVNVGSGNLIEEDMLAFEFWTRQWGWIYDALYQTTSTSGTLLCAIPVTPMIASTNLVPVPGAMPCLIASRWVGSMEYRVTISATPFHRGKLLLAYIPSVATVTQPTIATLMNTCHTCVVDVTQSTDVCVRVGWSQPGMVATMAVTNGGAFGVLPGNNNTQGGGYFVNASNIMATTGALLGCNGQLILVVFDALSATAAGSLIVNIWARPGPDMQFGGANGSTASSYITTGGPAAPATDFEQQAPQLDDEQDVCHMGGDLVAPGIHRRLNGEELLSFRPFLKRPFAWCSMSPSATNWNGSQCDSIQWPMYQYPPVYHTATYGQPWAANAPNTGFVRLMPNIFSTLESCFAGMGGSMTHKLFNYAAFPYQNIAPLRWLVSACDGDDPLFSGTGGTQPPTVLRFSSNLNTTVNINGVNAAMGRVSAGLEFAAGEVPLEITVPHLSNQFYTPPQDSAATHWGTLGFLVTWITWTANLIVPGVTQMSAIGEDFNFVYFLGCPALAIPLYTPLGYGYSAST